MSTRRNSVLFTNIHTFHRRVICRCEQMSIIGIDFAELVTHTRDEARRTLAGTECAAASGTPSSGVQ
jgi:hypothetical protein